MKYLVLSISVLLLACNKKQEDPQATPQDCNVTLTTEPGYQDLPNWEPSFLISEPIPESTKNKDTMEAIIHEGKSYLKYNDRGYLLAIANDTRTYKEGDSLIIVKVYDKDCQLMCYATVKPFRYLDNNKWVKQKQTFEVLKDKTPLLSPFDNDFGQYYSWRPF